MAKPSILIVEDEAVVALDLKMQLQDLGYAISGVVHSGAAALALLAQRQPTAILMDVRLHGAMDGIATTQAIHQHYNIPVIYLTAHSDADTVRRATASGAHGYLTKPFQIEQLRASIDAAVAAASRAQPGTGG
jgi:CheY-like chemotaxis protein